jgi:hypothetical protein
MSAPAVARRTARVACPVVEEGSETAVTLIVNDRSVLAVAQRLHDEKCSEGPGCDRRSAHALDCFGAQARKMLGALVAAYEAQEI